MATNPFTSLQANYTQLTGRDNLGSGMGTGPIQYSSPINTIRPQQPNININAFGTGTPEDRITAMASKQYEKWAAGNQFRSQQAEEIEAAKKAALGGIKWDPRLSGGYHMNGGNTEKHIDARSDYSKFMSSPDSGSGPEGKMQNWNKLVAAEGQKYRDALTPVWAKYGIQPYHMGPQTIPTW